MSPKDLHKPVYDPTPEEIAWAAGFYEGEGSLSLYIDKKTGYGHYKVSCGQKGQNGKELLERFKKIVGFGSIYPQKSTLKYMDEPMYMWEGNAYFDVTKMYEQFQKWLGSRRWNKYLLIKEKEAQSRVGVKRRRYGYSNGVPIK